MLGWERFKMMAAGLFSAGSELSIEGWIRSSSRPSHVESQVFTTEQPYLQPPGPRFPLGFRMRKLQDLQVHIGLRIQPVHEDQIWNHLKREPMEGDGFSQEKSGIMLRCANHPFCTSSHWRDPRLDFFEGKDLQ